MATIRPTKTISSDSAEQTRRFWSERTGEQVSCEDAREMAENISAFFRVLSQWDKRATETNDSDASCSAVGRGRKQNRPANRTCPD